jgi:hypothetical protein
MTNIKRTQFAQAAVDFSGLFAIMFEKVRVLGSTPRIPELVAPGGMSTAGGKQILQHITLRPEVAGPPVLTVGWVDLAQRTALLRTYGHMAQLHRARFGNSRPFDLDVASYQAFLDHCRRYFDAQAIRIQYEDESVQLPAPAKSPQQKNNTTLILIIVALLLLLLLTIAGGAGAYFFLVLRR